MIDIITRQEGLFLNIISCISARDNVLYCLENRRRGLKNLYEVEGKLR